jgi:predicted branched-subunit amino acid permease
MSEPVNTRSQQFLAGVRAEIPILVGVAPFGMIYGALAIKSGLPTLQSQMMSSIVFAGSSQFILVPLVVAGAPALVMVLTIFVVNLRHALYSASLAPFVQHLSPRWKMILAYLLTDEAYAVTILHYERDAARPVSVSAIPEPAVEPVAVSQDSATAALPDYSTTRLADYSTGLPDYRHWFFLGAGLALWTTWQISTAIGISLGAIVPASWELDFTLALTFIALVIPNLKDRAGVGAALAAGLVSMLAFTMPYKLGLIVAALIGVVAGLFIENREQRQ